MKKQIILAGILACMSIGAKAQYDDLSSKNDWIISKDEQAAIIGAQYKLGKYVKLAPNFRITSPKAAGADKKCFAYVNFYFGL